MIMGGGEADVPAPKRALISLLGMAQSFIRGGMRDGAITVRALNFSDDDVETLISP